MRMCDLYILINISVEFGEKILVALLMAIN